MFQLNLKTTIIYSCIVAGLLNIWQFAASHKQRQDAFAPSRTLAERTTPGALTTSAKAGVIEPNPATTSAGAAAVSAPQPNPGAPAVADRLARAGLKSEFAGLYLSVQAQTGVPWQLLAAVHRVETGQAHSTTRTSYAGATGPMQFMPATFRAYGVDGDGDGHSNIHDLEDAMLSAGRYLAANGAARGNYQNALYRYNHSWSYVSKVRGIAGQLGL
jgi:membrane-bound lytic murein transglycosylase B